MPALLISKLNACGLSESDDQEGGARADHRHEGGGKEDQDGCVLCFKFIPCHCCSNLSVDKQKESLQFFSLCISTVHLIGEYRRIVIRSQLRHCMSCICICYSMYLTEKCACLDRSL